jgi:3-oxoadipate enol-lactonase
MPAASMPSQDVVDEFVGNSHGNLSHVRELLAADASLAQSVASWGETPIQAAAQTGQREIVELLLAAGAPLDICTAAMLGDLARVQAFLAADANLARASGAHGLPVMYYPACNGRIDIAELLLAHDSPVNSSVGVSPPLHGAVYFDQPAMAEWLLAHGAEADALDYSGRSALQIATDKQRSEIATLLRRHGGRALASGFVDVSGGKLYYETVGEGPALVLIHAGIADHTMWDAQVPDFSARFRVIRFDVRGFGRSQSQSVEFSHRQDLADLLKHLGVDKASVIGVSMGGQIATDFTLEHPELVSALIPVAAGLSGSEHQPGADAKSAVEARMFAEMEALWERKELQRLNELELEMWVDGPLQPADRVAAAVREKVGAMIAASNDRPDEGTTSQRLSPPAVGRLAEIKVPVLVVVGDLDANAVLADCDVLAKQIAGARKVIIPGTAHMLTMERPHEFNRIILDFLAADPRHVTNEDIAKGSS